MRDVVVGGGDGAGFKRRHGQDDRAKLPQTLRLCISKNDSLTSRSEHKQHLLVSIVASISACHAEDQGSIP